MRLGFWIWKASYGWRWITFSSLYTCDHHNEYRRSGNFHVKNNLCENFRGVKFSRFRSIREFFLTVDYCNMDEYLESSWRLVYYQVSGEPGITRCSRRSDIYLVEYGLARKLIQWSLPHNFIFRVFNFRGWSRPQNYFNSEIFPIYGTLILPWHYP